MKSFFAFLLRALLFVPRWLSGKTMATVVSSVPDRMDVIRARARQFVRDVLPSMQAREHSNRALLTGMVVALLAGPNVLPFSGWERYKFSSKKANGAKGLPARLVGWPLVYEYPLALTSRTGETEWVPDHVSRHDQLIARGRKHRA